MHDPEAAQLQRVLHFFDEPHAATEVRAVGPARDPGESARDPGEPAPQSSASSGHAGALWTEARSGMRGTVPPPPMRAPSRTAQLPLAARRALGGLLPTLDDPELRDLLVQVRDGTGGLWLDRGGQTQRVPGWRTTPQAVHRLATALVAAGGRHLDELVPAADVRLGDGIRVHAVLPPVAVAGTSVSIRVPRLVPLTFGDAVAGGLCRVETADRLRAVVHARKNLLITGGTGTGKTTLLAALMDLVEPHERIVTIEDLAELRLRHPHVVALEARQASSEGVGQVGLAELVREALRMRPDRVVLGECRGAEIATLLTAFNTGHDGGAGTLHASSLAEVPARIEALGALAGMTSAALGRQAAAGLDLVIHLSRVGGAPRITGVGRLRHDPRHGLAIEAGPC
ncbi:Flp pilus assembly protein, ATPase CpaF [Leucobacter sp. 7(1)]|nr:Flp pilus assembly protein, ATPase CpaF [Leucobacter sp. 7(1)]